MILVTGGTGYIGSHCCVALLEAGHEIVAVDNLSNSGVEVLKRIERITKRSLAFHRLDLRNRSELSSLFAQYAIRAVLHFAGLKAVSESIAKPLEYYGNNVVGTVRLLEAMRAHGVKSIVFSSSATVYGTPKAVPVSETAPLAPDTPYGRTKLVIENVLRDLCGADPAWRVAILRYFNPVGAHPSGLLGEDPKGIPNNLMPCIARVAAGQLPELKIYGSDYPTKDGTGVRDYIHVVDLVQGHLSAVRRVQDGYCNLLTLNLGTGRGYTVLEVLHGFEEATGMKIPYRIVGRRPGDVASCIADPTRAETELQWRATRSLPEMCKDVWRWQSGPVADMRGPEAL